MSDPAAQAELVDHLCRVSRLTAAEAEHIINEVLNFYAESVEEFVRRRHQELQLQGFSNQAIYSQIQKELRSHRFATKPLTTRQIRRAIYG